MTHKVVVGKHLTKYEVNHFVNLVILFLFLGQGVTQFTRRNKEMSGKKREIINKEFLSIFFSFLFLLSCVVSLQIEFGKCEEI